jgi:hypothetical protein
MIPLADQLIVSYPGQRHMGLEYDSDGNVYKTVIEGRDPLVVDSVALEFDYVLRSDGTVVGHGHTYPNYDEWLAAVVTDPSA